MKITCIAIFDDQIFIYRGHRLRKYYTDWQRSARIRRAIVDRKDYRQLSRAFFENYVFGKRK